MNCDECRQQMPEYLENDLADDARREIASHLDVCAVCRSELEESRGLLDTARALPRHAPRAAVVLRIGEAIHAAALPPRRTEFGPVMDVDELADFLRVDAETLSLYLGGIPSFELGGKLLFRRKSVEEWIERRESDFGMEAALSALKRSYVAPSRKTGGASWTN